MNGARTRLTAPERRRSIVDVGLRLLARQGFEGLRTRDVAAAAKINTATLHHYVATKEDIVAAVAERIYELFQREHAPPIRARVGLDEPLLALRQQFADVSFYGRERPELVAAYRELVGRASRDEAVRHLVDNLNAGWRNSINAILRRGQDAGVFRSDCNPSAVADMVIAASWGFLVLLQLTPAAYARACGEIEQGLLAQSKRGRAT
jgi:AcrR family transcriptional regulator